MSFEDDERPDDCWVYMLLCRDDGPYYIKVGISQNPVKRLSSLRTACGVKARMLLCTEVWSRRAAARIEASVHAALDEWRVEGEWFKVQPEDRDRFNAAWSPVFAQYRNKSYPLELKRVSLPEVDRVGELYRRNGVRRWPDLKSLGKLTERRLTALGSTPVQR